MFIAYSSWICQGEAMAVNALPDLSAQGCRALQFVSPREGKALVNHVIKNVSVGSSDVCEIECYLDNRCLSYNYGDQGNVRHKCELSDSDHKQHPNDLQERLGYIYRGTENECSSNPCSLNGKCVIDAADNKYRCHCHPGYYGDHCEQALPIASYSKEVGITGGLCSYYTYKINGTTSDSKELIFQGLHSPLWVTIGQEFRIWHGQDLTGCSEINNSGQTCADVYAWYTH